MTASTANLIIGLINVGLANTPAAVTVIQGLLSHHAQESPEEAAQITMQTAARVKTITEATDTKLDAVDTAKQPGTP